MNAVLDTSNKFCVMPVGEALRIVKVPALLSKAEACNLAAWLSVLSDPNEVRRIEQEISRPPAGEQGSLI